jgi:transposase
LIALAFGHPDWVVGFQDEVWWSRYAQPHLQTWTEDKPLRLRQNEPDRQDPEPKAVACYGVLRADTQGMLLRFVDGRPVSAVTTQFVQWVTDRLVAEGKTALLMVWDNAS